MYLLPHPYSASMYVLILTLVLGNGTPPAMTTAEFSGQDTCQQAANAWKAQARLVYGTVHVITVCVPK